MRIDEDMTLIKQLEDDEGEDWSTITDFKMMDE